MSSTDLERMSLSSSANSVASSARTLSANVRKLHNALNLLLNDFEREQFIHCLNVYHSKRNVYDLVQTLNVILNAPSKRQLLPMLRLVIPRSDQLLFEQYTSEGLYLKSDLVASNGNAETPPGDFPSASPTPPGHFSPNKPPEFQVALRGSPDSFSTSSDGTAPSLVPLLGRNFIHEPPGELRQVTMKRHKSNEGLGFSIRGGSEHGVGIYVSLVEPGSLAEKEGLRIGDQIMKVNDKVFDKVTHAEAVKEAIIRMMKKSGSDKFNIVCWVDSFFHMGHYCLEFEKLDINLFEFLQRSPDQVLPLKQIRPILQQLATGLQFLKSLGIAHADLKPGNIMMVDHLRQPLRVKIIDFGFACTDFKEMMGSTLQTRVYRAPEIILGCPFDEAIDIWSLGCTAAKLLTGVTMFRGSNTYDMMRLIMHVAGRPPAHMLDSGMYTNLFFYQEVKPGPWKFMSSLKKRDSACTSRTITCFNDLMTVLKGSKKLCLSVRSVGRIPGGYVTNHVYTWVDPQGRGVSPPPDLPEHRSATLRRSDSQRRSNMQLLQEGDEKKVNLVLDDGRSLGLMIRGGAEYALGIYITGVDQGSAAECGGLKVGDQILEVNGRSFLSIPHDEAVRVLKSSRHLMMTVKDVGRLPHARTVVGETKWIASSQIAESSANSSMAGFSVDQGASAAGKPGFYKGVAGSQVTLSSLVNQSRAMLEEQARHLLTEVERQTMGYYVEEYRDGHIGVEQLVMALFELFNTHAKFSLLSEVRGLVAPQDLECFDGMVLRREIQALKARQGTSGAAALQQDSLSMVSYPDTLTSSSASFMTNTTLSSARNDGAVESNEGDPPESLNTLLTDISLDDVQSTTAESPPSFKPPPPPGVQRRPSRRGQLNKCPSSESSHSGLYFTAPTSHNQSKEPGHAPASPSLHHKREHPRDPSRDYAAIRKRDTLVPSKKEQITAAQLSMVTQHNIGPFPRVQSPSRAAKPAAPSPPPPPPPPLPAPHPPPSLPLKSMSMSKAPPASSPTSKQQFVTVEVHRPNAEPDVNEVRPLPQARGGALSQLSDSGQTLSEDSGVDIAESGHVSKDSSPHSSRTRLPRDTQGGGGDNPSKPPGLLEPTSTLVRVAKSASTLGIAIEGGANTRQPLPRIVTIQRGGSAHNCGQLKVGQVILEVNGVSLRGREHRDAARIIAEAFKTKERDYVDFLVTEFNVAL